MVSLRKYEKFLWVSLVCFTILFPYLRIKFLNIPLYFLYVPQLLLIVFYFINGNCRFNSSLVLPLFIFLLTVILTISYNNDQIINRIYLLLQKFLPLGLLVVIISAFNNKDKIQIKERVSFIECCIILFASLVSIWGILQVVNYSPVIEFTHHYAYNLCKIKGDGNLQGLNFRYSVPRASAGLWNSNVYVSVLGSILPIILFHKFKNNFIRMPIIILNVLGICASGSRQGLFVLLIITFVYCISFKVRFSDKIVFANILLVGFVVILFNLDSFEQTISRFIGTDSLTSGVSTRSSGYKNFLYFVNNELGHIFIGYGIGFRNAAEYGDYKVPFVSNSILLVVVQYGLLGAVSYFWFFFRMFLCAHQLRSRLVLFSIAFFMLSDNAMELSFINQSLLSILFILIITDSLNYEIRF